MRMIVMLAAWFAIVISVAHTCQAAAPDVILHHAKIVTLDDKFSVVEAIAVTGNKITAVGTNDDVLKLKGENTRVIDLGGKMVLPGLIDSHTHPNRAAMHEFDHDVPDMESIADVLAYIKSRAAVLAEGKWIEVNQVFITRLKEPRYPTKAELDAAAPKHAVVFATGPDAMLSSLALAKSGIDKDFKTTGPGFIEKDPATGEPTGLLRNCKRYIKSEPSGRKATEAEADERLRLLLADYNSVGITGIADRAASAADVVRYMRLRDGGKLTCRTAISWHVETTGKLADIEATIREVAKNPLCQGDVRLKIVGVKTYLDGGMLTGSAYMREPWGVSEIYSIRDPEYRGVLFIPKETLLPIVKTCVENKLQFTAHSVGDGAVHTLLDVYEELSKTLDVRSTRPCVTHSNFMSREAVEQLVRVGAVADLQPAWLYLDARTLTTQFGEKRLTYFQPLKSLFDAGAVVGGGSDHMQKIGSLRSINPYNPFLAMWVTLTRKARWFEGQLHPEQALTREQAIRFYTRNNAYITFKEKEIGSLEPGKLADFIVLDRDLLTCPVDDVRDTQVLQTWFDGKLIYERK